MTNEEQQLVALWQSRTTLDAPGWEALFTVVRRLLTGRCHAPELGSLAENRADYIQMFFVECVFHPNRRDGATPNHAGALCAWFRNMLRDILKSAAYRREMFGIETDQFDEESAPLPVDPLAADCAMPDGEETALRESARGFLGQLDTIEIAYLKLNACEDDPEPLSSLAKRMQIASYHYRARQLGITKQGDTLPADYAKTKIGRWLTEGLGLTIAGEDVENIFEAFKILCHEALLWKDPLVENPT